MIAPLVLAALLSAAPAGEAAAPPADMTLETMLACGKGREEAMRATGAGDPPSQDSFFLRRSGPFRFGKVARDAHADLYLTLEGQVTALIVTWPFPEDASARRGPARSVAEAEARLAPGAAARAAFEQAVANATALYGPAIEENKNPSRPFAIWETATALIVLTTTDEGGVSLRHFCREWLGKTADMAVNREGVNYRTLLGILRAPSKFETVFSR